MKRFSILALVLFASCSKPASKESSNESPETPPVATPSATTPAPQAEAPPEIRPIKGTGVRERMVLAALNYNVGLEPKYHHEFFYVMTTDPPGSIRMFGDKHSNIRLMLSGPSDDLEMMSLLMDMKDLLTEKNGKPDGEGGAAWGRCVRRMAIAADPNWGDNLYMWMCDNMTRAFLSDDGITNNHNHLRAKFGTVRGEGPNANIGAFFMIGTPAKE